jgi:membrane protein implicated in regulation of membrane protease activity
MITLKFLAVAFAVLGLVAAIYWWKASRVSSADPRDSGSRQPDRRSRRAILNVPIFF